MCGDYYANGEADGAGAGSPPHVRGLLIFFNFYFPPSGITPACAGTTLKKP